MGFHGYCIRGIANRMRQNVTNDFLFSYARNRGVGRRLSIDDGMFLPVAAARASPLQYVGGVPRPPSDNVPARYGEFAIASRAEAG
jgi:hypothetical protein